MSAFPIARFTTHSRSFETSSHGSGCGARRSLSHPVSIHASSVRSTSASRTLTPKRSSVRRLTGHPDSHVPRTPSAPRMYVRDEPVTGAAHINSESKAGLSLGELGPLVIILSQIESIPSIILQEFIELTSVYVSEENTLRPHTLPVILIFGLCTSPEVSFESRLSASILARLCIRVFTAPPPTSVLEAVMNEVSSCRLLFF